MANRNAEVAEGLEQHSAQFPKGQWGRLDLDLARPPTEGEILWLTARADSDQLRLKRWTLKGSTLSITFQAGGSTAAPAIVPLVLGNSGVAVLAWRLYTLDRR